MWSFYAEKKNILVQLRCKFMFAICVFDCQCGSTHLWQLGVVCDRSIKAWFQLSSALFFPPCPLPFIPSVWQNWSSRMDWYQPWNKVIHTSIPPPPPPPLPQYFDTIIKCDISVCRWYLYRQKYRAYTEWTRSVKITHSLQSLSKMSLNFIKDIREDPTSVDTNCH